MMSSGTGICSELFVKNFHIQKTPVNVNMVTEDAKKTTIMVATPPQPSTHKPSDT